MEFLFRNICRTFAAEIKKVAKKKHKKSQSPTMSGGSCKAGTDYLIFKI